MSIHSSSLHFTWHSPRRALQAQSLYRSSKHLCHHVQVVHDVIVGDNGFVGDYDIVGDQIKCAIMTIAGHWSLINKTFSNCIDTLLNGSTWTLKRICVDRDVGGKTPGLGAAKRFFDESATFHHC